MHDKNRNNSLILSSIHKFNATFKVSSSSQIQLSILTFDNPHFEFFVAPQLYNILQTYFIHIPVDQNHNITRIVDYKVGQSENVNKKNQKAMGCSQWFQRLLKFLLVKLHFIHEHHHKGLVKSFPKRGLAFSQLIWFPKYFEKTKKILFSKHGGMLHHWSFCQPSPFVPIFF